MDLTTFTTAALLAFALYTGQNFLRYLKALDWNGVLGILLSWALGFGIAWWAAQAAITAKLVLVTDAGPLGKMDTGSLLLLGLSLGSAAPVVSDFFKARDNTQSAAKPRLLAPAAEEPPAA